MSKILLDYEQALWSTKLEIKHAKRLSDFGFFLVHHGSVKQNIIYIFFSFFIKVPAVVVIIPLLAKLGRVKCYSGTFIAGGICCCLVALVTSVTSGQGWAIALSVAIGIVGKFLISMTFAIAYLYTAELFPTKVRNLAVGLASTFARIGKNIHRPMG